MSITHLRPDSPAGRNVKTGRSDSPLWRHTVPTSGFRPRGLPVLGPDAAVSGSGKGILCLRGGTTWPGRAGWHRRAITSPCGPRVAGVWSFQRPPQCPEDGLVLQKQLGSLLTPA